MPRKKEVKIESGGDLEEAIDEIKQKFGAGAIMKLKEAKPPAMQWRQPWQRKCNRQTSTGKQL